jgi:two-component system response regulator DegU
MKTKIKIAVVDDQQLFRKGLIALIKEFEDIEVIIEAASAMELMEKLTLQRPDLVLLDYKMPIMNGLQTTRMIREEYPGIKILILTMFDEGSIITDLVEKGVNGVLLKGCEIELLIEAIHMIRDNNYFFNEYFPGDMKYDPEKRKRPDHSTLSAREIEIIRLLCKELTNREIATKLFISSRTVDGHREKILRKINAKNVTGIVLYAIRNNLLDD